jgi:hypothetical protein
LFYIYSRHVQLLFGYFENIISDAFNILIKYAKISDIDLHQRSPHGKDALVYKDHIPEEFLIISQLEPKIWAFLVSGRGNLPKTMHPYRIHPLSNFELNFLLVNVINIDNNSTKFHQNL